MFFCTSSHRAEHYWFANGSLEYVRPVFEDLLKRLQIDYIDLGMIHYVDSVEEWEQIQHSDYLEYVMELSKTRLQMSISVHAFILIISLKGLASTEKI